MKNGLYQRLFVTVFALFLCTATALAPMTAGAQGHDNGIICSGLPCNVGLVMDKRGNLYTADRATGRVFCLPPGHAPILYAEIPDTPTALAVDRLRNVFVGTDRGTVYMISLDGTVTEVFRCNAPSVGVEVDRDGTLMVATGAGDIFRVDRSGFYKQQ